MVQLFRRHNTSKINLILSLAAVSLIVIPFILIFLIQVADKKGSNDSIFLIGTILMTLSIPMAIVVSVLLGITLVSTSYAIYKREQDSKDIIAFVITIISIIVSIVGIYKFLVFGAELIDVILRMG